MSTKLNAAVDEIEARLRKFGNQAVVERAEIATIHSFCLQFILRPYSWLIPEIPKNFSIIGEFSPEFRAIVDIVEEEHNRRPHPRIYEQYAALRANAEGHACGTGIESGGLTSGMAQFFWQVCRRRGYLDFSMILFYAMRILREYPFVARGLSSKFAWLLIDEYQDTTDV